MATLPNINLDNDGDEPDTSPPTFDADSQLSPETPASPPSLETKKSLWSKTFASFRKNAYRHMAQHRKHSEDYGAFLRDYEVEGWLGSGTFGSVARVTNKLEDKEYALKLIPIKVKDRQFIKSHKSVQEAQTLAQVSTGHMNVVRFYHAWVEPLTPRLREFVYPEEEEKGEDINTVQINVDSYAESDSQNVSKHTSPANIQAIILDGDDDGEPPSPSISDDGAPPSPIVSDLGSSIHSTLEFTVEPNLSVDQELDLSALDTVRSIEDLETVHSNTSTISFTGSVRIISDDESDEDTLPFLRSYGSENDTVPSETMLQNGESMATPAFLKSDSDPSKMETVMGGTEQGYNYILFIQMELCNSNTLREYLVQRSYGCEHPELEFDEQERLQIFQQVLFGVEHIHQQGFMHRDLKPENIFLEDGVVKIGDFGLMASHSVPLEDETVANKVLKGESVFHTSWIGTPLYAAPEQMWRRDYDFSVDVFALGIILFELMYPNFSNEREHSRMIKRVRQGRLPPEFSDKNPVVARLVLSCCSEADNRPTVSELLSERIFRDKDSELEDSIRQKFARDLQNKDDLIAMLYKKIEEKEKVMSQKTELIHRLSNQLEQALLKSSSRDLLRKHVESRTL